MKRLQYWITAILLAAGIGGSAMATLVPQTVSAAEKCENRILTIPPWYRGMTDGSCNLKGPSDYGGVSNYIWRIALNVVEILLHIVGYIAVGYIIYGGFNYLISAGSSDKIQSAKRTITNAAVGLVISILSIAIVNLVVGAF